MKRIRLLLPLLAFFFLNHRTLANPALGYLIGWGDNIAGQATGMPFFGTSTGMVTVAGQNLTNVIAVAAGYAHGLALKADSTVVGWGYNRSGQATGYKVPHPYNTNGLVMLNGQILSNVTALAAWGNCSLALKNDGTVVGWGDIEVPAELNNVVAITKGQLVLKHDNKAIEWRTNSSKFPVDELTNVVAVAAGHFHRLVIKKDGTVVRLGPDKVLPPGLNDIKTISVGWNAFAGEYCLALKKDGTLVAWGADGFGQATVPEGLSNVIAIAAGETHNLALKQDGMLVAWGDNRGHATDIPTGLSNVVAIAAGANFCLAITTNNYQQFLKQNSKP